MRFDRGRILVFLAAVAVVAANVLVRTPATRSAGGTNEQIAVGD